MPHRRNRVHYEQLSEFERCRILGLKDIDWANRRIVRHMDRSDAANKRCWQEWVDYGRFQPHDGSGRPRIKADWEDRVIIPSAITTQDSSLSTIKSATSTRVSTMTIHRRLIELNLRSY
ncbi:HTH_Tnp_Tc3_2 domain-containing protein [Trichonephila clavipes]|nr:HTH_Tnp_Tc3_2 domain-containing protein [Trichonephila clavipes]